MDRRLFVLGFGPVLAGCAVGAAETYTLAPSSRLIIFRHADRDSEELSEHGRRRAIAFVSALDGVQVDAIFAFGMSRNIDTATPLANARGLPVQTLAPRRLTQRLIAESAGRSVVWVGNMGNLTMLWQELALEGSAPVDYGDLHIVESDAAGRIRVTRRRVEV